MIATLLVFPENDAWKNVYSFEHAMAHRGLMSVMGPLTQWSIMPYYIDPQLYDADPGTNWHKNHQQAHNDFTSYLPAYSAAQLPPGVALQGSIAAVHLTAGGSGYTTVPSVTVNTTTGSGATFHVTIGTAAPHAVTAISVTNGGSGYSTTDTLTISGPGTGAAATLSFNVANIAAVSQGSSLAGAGIPSNQILIDSNFKDRGSRSWWTFANHQEHLVAANAIQTQWATDPTYWWALPPRRVTTFW